MLKILTCALNFRAIGSAVTRLYYCVKLEHTEDVSYYTWLAGIWAFPEIMFGIMVASLPAFRPFFREFAKSKFYKTISSSLQKIATLSATRTRTWNRRKGDISDDSNEMNPWPPTNGKSGPGMTWVHAAYGGETGSTEGLRVNTTIETSIEHERV